MNQRPIQGLDHDLKLWKEAKLEKQRQEIIKIHQREHAKRVEECLRHFNLLQKSHMNNEEKWINHIKKYCHFGDKEMDHIEADKALTLFLLSLGYSKIVEEWEKVEKWYS